MCRASGLYVNVNNIYPFQMDTLTCVDPWLTHSHALCKVGSTLLVTGTMHMLRKEGVERGVSD